MGSGGRKEGQYVRRKVSSVVLMTSQTTHAGPVSKDDVSACNCHLCKQLQQLHY